jgi:hypothetical protein
MKEQINIYKVVNHDKETGEIEVLDYVFCDGNIKDKDVFKGATGTRFEAVSEEQYNDQTSKDAIMERLEGCYNMRDLPDFAQQAALEAIYERMDAAGEIESFAFDLSYQNEVWDELRKLGYPEDKYPVFNCTGGGRMFTAPYKGNMSEELNALINKYESK